MASPVAWASRRTRAACRKVRGACCASRRRCPSGLGRVGAAARESFLARVGRETAALVQASREVVAFLGEVTIAFGRLLRGQARFRRSDLMLILQEVGAQALPIVSMISFLVGVILAFLGSIQLLQFGAQIYVADLVGIGMARDMAAMMVGIILAGRTGAAFAAQLGTMQVNEEIDALATLGLSPMEFLVLPRILALVLMTPLLCLYANLMGLLGGAFVGVDVPRPTGRDLPAGDAVRPPAGRLRRPADQGRRVRRRGRGRRLPARHAVRPQLRGGRPGDHLGGGDLDRVHRDLHGHLDPDLQCPRRLKRRRGPQSQRRRRRRMRTSWCATWTMAYGSFVLIRDLDFTVRRGDIFVIMGGSGCGKSTLLRHMIGLKRRRAARCSTTA